MASAETKPKNPQPWKDEGLKRDEWIAREVAKAVNAGKEWDLETVDFADPNRPATCLEVDFPIVPLNEIAAIEGSSGSTRKPIYQITKWWARRNSCVFRSMLLAAAIKSPDDAAEAAKLVWNVYYGNHQSKKLFKNLNVADIFMGGGTTLVEGSRLGMRMHGNDLNPVAWFVTSNGLASVEKSEICKLLADVEARVKPEIMPFFACDCPRGHRGVWTRASTGEQMDETFDAFSIAPEERRDYEYDGPEIIYTFWIKHGPCAVRECGHRTPIVSNPVLAIKTLSVRAWKHECKTCTRIFDLEERDARIAPGAPHVGADPSDSYAVVSLNTHGVPVAAICPHCASLNNLGALGKSFSKKVELSLLVHPKWLKGDASVSADGRAFGGRAGDSADATICWNNARAESCAIIEVRGKLKDSIELPDGVTVALGARGGTVSGKSQFACAACGTSHDILDAVKATGKTGSLASPVIQGYCKACDNEGQPYSGRFFSLTPTAQFNAAELEWERRRNDSLKGLWPDEELPYGLEADFWSVRLHGYTHWWKMFSSRQLLVHASLLHALNRYASSEARSHSALYVLGAFQQYLRNNCLFTIWNTKADQLEPQFAKNNFRPKTTVIENNVFGKLGRGNWVACADFLLENLTWKEDPWDLVSTNYLANKSPSLKGLLSSKSAKVNPGDPVAVDRVHLSCRSSSDLSHLTDGQCDLVITDPPFGGLLQYSELSDFFYVWLKRYNHHADTSLFSDPDTPKALEAVANKARQKDPDEFYERVLTACWKEAYRIMKPGATLAFTFHHSEDEPWVSVLESLFNAGFYLEATYPIRSDESKGDNAEFGSQKIEYDIIHVCRKRHSEVKAISWAKLRRQVLDDVRALKDLLEHHQEEGLPEADLQVIRRGKALEHFSRHYGRVFKDEDSPISVLEALLGINQILDEEAGGIKDPPPPNAEPFTRMLLRLFDGKAQLPRDQMQKFLRGTGSGPSDFVDRGWVVEKKKVFHLVPPLELAQQWIGKQRRGMTSDYDQTMYLIGACYEGSGINANDTLSNPNFRPHPALGAILAWFKTHGADSAVRNAATLAGQLYRTLAGKNQAKADQLTFFDDLGEDDD